MNNPSDVGKISLPFRAAAWVLFLGGGVVLVDVLTHIPDLRVEARADAVFSGVAGIFGLFMFGYIALTGRAPGFLLLLEGSWNSRLGAKPSFNPASRIQLVCWIVAVVTGAGLIAAADASDLFGEEIRGLVLLIYAIAAVALVALVWRLARLPPNKSLERTREG